MAIVQKSMTGKKSPLPLPSGKAELRLHESQRLEENAIPFASQSSIPLIVDSPLKSVKRFVLGLALALCLVSAGCYQKSDVPEPADSSSGNANQVTVETSQGSFVIQLNSSVAPITTENFRKNVDSGAYNNTLIHEVLNNCIVMMGGYKPTMGASSSQTIKNESSALNPNKKWTVAAMHAPNNTQSDTMQILINMTDNPELDFVAPGTTPDTCGYCVFGEIVSGREVLEKINKTSVQVQGDFEFAPVPPITISKMTREKSSN